MTGALVRGIGLGLALASVLILMWGQPWDPKAIRERWTTRFGFSSRPIVGEVYIWLNARVAALVLIAGLAVQVTGTALGGSSSAAAGWGWSVGVMLVVGIGISQIWIRSREPLITRRLVAVALDAGMPDVSDIQFLWHLDQDRAMPLVTVPDGLVMDPGAGAPPGPVAQELLGAAAYGRHPAFGQIALTRDAHAAHAHQLGAS